MGGETKKGFESKVKSFRTRPFYHYIASLFLLFFLIIAALMILIGFRQGYADHYSRLQFTFGRQSSQVAQTLQLRIVPIRKALRLLTYESALTQVSYTAKSRAVPMLAEILASNPDLASIYAGYPNGDFLLLRRFDRATRNAFPVRFPTATTYVIQVTDKSNASSPRSFIALDSALRVVDSVANLDTTFDPRTRQWYSQALGKSSPTMTSPYIFHTTRQTGITLSLANPDQSMVLGADILVNDLSRQLEAMELPQGIDMVLCDGDGKLIASRRHIDSSIVSRGKLPNLSDVGLPAFALLHRYLTDRVTDNTAAFETELDNGTTQWLASGTAMPNENGAPFFLIQIIPEQLVIDGARKSALWSVLPLALAWLVLFPGILLVARRTTRPLHSLKDEVRAIQRFDFDSQNPRNSHIQEIDELSEALLKTRRTIREFMSIGRALAEERDFDSLMKTILRRSIDTLQAQGGVLYLRAKADGSKATASMQPVQAYWQGNSRNGLSAFDKTSDHPLVPALLGKRTILDENHDMSAFVALSEDCKDCYTIAIPLEDHTLSVIGVLVLFLSRTDRDDLDTRLAMAEALAGTAAMALDTQQLVHEQKMLLDALIEIMAGAIDAKSPYTGGHCQRVPILANLLAEAAEKSTEGPLASFRLDNESREALRIASWLHDCGKVTTPEFVVDKATKLETIYDRIHEIRMRFEVIKRERKIALLEQSSSPGILGQVAEKLAVEWKNLDDDFAFIASLNPGSGFMDDAMRERLHKIAALTWTRTIDDMQGISKEDVDRIVAAGGHAPVPAIEPLLADKPEHKVPRPEDQRLGKHNPWGIDLPEPEYLYNKGELHNLLIPRGTLNEEERYKINEHVIQTIVMLDKLPFPGYLLQVPEFAGGHHEKLDGKGYPRRLTEENISLPARMIAMADVFEALTAFDRPYKPPKTISQALSIMAHMVNDKHLDKNLFVVMLTSGLWKSYAEQYLPPQQLDEVETDKLLAMLK